MYMNRQQRPGEAGARPGLSGGAEQSREEQAGEAGRERGGERGKRINEARAGMPAEGDPAPSQSPPAFHSLAVMLISGYSAADDRFLLVVHCGRKAR